MRSHVDNQGQLFSYAGLEEYVPSNHPLRRVRTLVGSMLKETDDEFEKLYSDVGHPSIPPEHLLRSLVLHILTPSAASDCWLNNCSTTCRSSCSSG